jgi:hypothetical protein
MHVSRGNSVRYCDASDSATDEEIQQWDVSATGEISSKAKQIALNLGYETCLANTGLLPVFY